MDTIRKKKEEGKEVEMQEVYRKVKERFVDFTEFVKMIRGMAESRVLKYTYDEEHFDLV